MPSADRVSPLSQQGILVLGRLPRRGTPEPQHVQDSRSGVATAGRRGAAREAEPGGPDRGGEDHPVGSALGHDPPGAPVSPGDVNVLSHLARKWDGETCSSCVPCTRQSDTQRRLDHGGPLPVDTGHGAPDSANPPEAQHHRRVQFSEPLVDREEPPRGHRGTQQSDQDCPAR